MHIAITFFFILFSYFVGSLPTGYIIARIAGVADITKHGSGNIGATNVARVLGKHYFFLIFFLDALKAFLVIRLAISFGLSNVMTLVVALLLLLGNGYSFLLGFRGGKGVATAVGVFAALSLPLVFIFIVLWSIVLMLTRTVGVASVVAALWLPFFAYYLDRSLTELVWLSCLIAIWLVYRHTDNIKNYWALLRRG